MSACKQRLNSYASENEYLEEVAVKLVTHVSLPNASRDVCRKNTQLLDAVENGDIKKITRLLKLDASPNATCQLNCLSACHVAAMIDNDSLSLLLTAGAQTYRTDELGRTPLHLAAWAGKSKQIALLLGYPELLQDKVAFKISPEVEVEIRNTHAAYKHLIDYPCKRKEKLILPDAWTDSIEHNCGQFNKHVPKIVLGSTPLHLASMRANYICVQLLFAAGADCNARDFMGRTPLDMLGLAHYSGFTIDVHEFNDCLKSMVVHGGIFKSNLLLNDAGITNTLLHTAVELESKEAIKELLKAGASPTCVNCDGLTPLHICVNKKLKEYLQLILNFDYTNRNNNLPVVDAKDKDGLTVIGAAISAEWIDGVRIALGAGADIFIQANDGNSPFHIAAAIGNIEIFEILLSAPATKYSTDKPNKYGQTALFIAIAHNQLHIVKLLVNESACFVGTHPRCFNTNVLHIAAKHGHDEILSFLLNCNVKHEYKQKILDDVANRLTPLFYAVVNNHPKCVSLLLIHGAKIDILIPYNDKRDKITNTTVMHIAAAENYIEIARLLLESDSKIVNKKNSSGFLPLHIACFHGNRNIITLLIQKGADLSAEHPEVKTPIQMIMNNLSKPTVYLEDIFDSYITTCGLSIEDKDYKVTIDYRVLLPNTLEANEVKVIKALLNTGNRYDQHRLLHHPLIDSFLCVKWKSLLPFFYVIVALYGCFVVSFNMYVLSVFYNTDQNKYEVQPMLYNIHGWEIAMYVIGGLILVQIIFMKIMTERSYFLFLETWTNFIATMLAMLLPTFIFIFTTEAEIMRGVTCVAVLLSWLEMMFLLCRFPRWGFYVLMFGKVTAKVLKVLMTFGFLILGFSICFMIQFRRNPPFETLWASVSKTLVMMTSEYDYSTTIDIKNSEDIEVHVSILRLIFVVFVILASVVLMNLMIGVAVNDVNNLEKIGKQRRLEKQVDFLSSLEGIDKYIRIILPETYYNARFFNESTVVTLSPYKQCCKYYKMLPLHVREGILEKAQAQQTQVDEEGTSYLESKLDDIQYALFRQNEKLEQFARDVMKKIDDHLKSIK